MSKSPVPSVSPRGTSRPMGHKAITDIEVANLAVSRTKHCASRIYAALSTRGEKTKFIGERNNFAMSSVVNRHSGSKDEVEETEVIMVNENEEGTTSFQWLSYADTLNLSLAFGTGLLQLNIATPLHSGVAVCLENGHQGMCALLGAAMKGCLIAPISTTISLQDCMSIFKLRHLLHVIVMEEGALGGMWLDAAFSTFSSVSLSREEEEAMRKAATTTTSKSSAGNDVHTVCGEKETRNSSNIVLIMLRSTPLSILETGKSLPSSQMFEVVRQIIFCHHYQFSFTNETKSSSSRQSSRHGGGQVGGGVINGIMVNELVFRILGFAVGLYLWEDVITAGYNSEKAVSSECKERQSGEEVIVADSVKLSEARKGYVGETEEPAPISITTTTSSPATANEEEALQQPGDVHTTGMNCKTELEKDDVEDIFHKVHDRPSHSLFTLVFTSGSSGTLKAAEFTDALWMDRCMKVLRYSQGEMIVLHESLAWMTGYKRFFDQLTEGGGIGIATGHDPELLFEDIEAIRPTRFGSVPLVWKALKDCYDRQVAMIVHRKHRGGNDEEEFAHRKVSHRFQKAFAACGILIIGGASSPPDVLAWIKKVFGSKFRESYGTTESGTIAEAFHDNNMLQIDHKVQFKLRDVPIMGYFKYNRPFARGELLVKSPGTIEQYSNNKAISSERFDKDGYFCTGDVVELHGERGIKIIDRLSNIVKLQQGVFVTPGTLCEHFSQAKSVTQVYVHASPFAEFVVAVVVANVPFFRAMFSLDPDVCTYGMLVNNTEYRTIIIESILAEFRKLGANFKPFEVPRQVVLAREPFMVDNGLLTVSEKPCRSAIGALYATELAEILLGGNDATAHHHPDGPISPAQQSPSHAALGRKSSREIIEEVLRCVHINVPSASSDKQLAVFLDSSLSEVGVSSMEVSVVKHTIETQFGCKLALSSLVGSVTLGEIATAVATGKVSGSLRGHGGKNTKHNSIDYWRRQRQMKPTLKQKLKDTSAAMFAAPSWNVGASSFSVLLLGATGFLGVHILSALIHEKHIDTIYCPYVDRENGKERISQALINNQLLDPEAAATLRASDRLMPLPISSCGLYDENFGLSPDIYKNKLVMNSNIQLVMNAAAMVDYVSDFSRCRDVNVGVVERCLEFCADCYLHRASFISKGKEGETNSSSNSSGNVGDHSYSPSCCIYHQVSTTSVLHVPRQQQRRYEKRKAKQISGERGKTPELLSLFEEQYLGEVPDAAMEELSGYVSSKLIAEEFCFEAVAQFGVPVVIHRVGMIGPSSSTGVSQPNNFVTRIFASALHASSYPNDVEPQCALVLNPVDHVAKGIAQLSTRCISSAWAGSLRVSHFVNAKGGIAMCDAWKHIASAFDEIIKSSVANELQSLTSSVADLTGTACTSVTSDRNESLQGEEGEGEVRMKKVMQGVCYKKWVALILSLPDSPIQPLRYSLNPSRHNNFDSFVSDAATIQALHKSLMKEKAEECASLLHQKKNKEATAEALDRSYFSLMVKHLFSTL